jgi:hypothetical protein
MTPTNDRPEWACSQFFTYEHDWQNCPACLVAFEIMIERAQDDSELDIAQQQASHSS